MENRFATIEHGKMQINTEAISKAVEEAKKSQMGRTELYHYNISEFLGVIEENHKQLIDVIDILGPLLREDFNRITVNVQGVPEAFSELTIDRNGILFQKVADIELFFDYFKYKDDEYIDFSKINGYDYREKGNNLNTVVYLCGSSDNRERFPMLRSQLEDVKALESAVNELGSCGINKELFVNSLINEVERIIEDIEKGYEEEINEDIEPDVELE